MQTCPRCKVTIRTRHKKCPLCQGVLLGDPQSCEVLFPELPDPVAPLRRVYQWITFLCLAVSLLCGILNYLITPGLFWSVYCIGAVGCTWVLLTVGIVKRKNLPKNITWELVLIVLIAVIWDASTGCHGWALNFVYPSACMTALASLVLVCILQKLDGPEYMIYFLLICVAGCLPMLFLVLGLVQERVISGVCFTLSVLVLMVLCVFRGREVVNELKKKFHF